MRTFVLTSPKWESEIRFEYYDSGMLAKCEFPEVIDVAVMEWFAFHNPVTVELLMWIGANSKTKVTEIMMDIDFDTFWTAYDKKSGSKELARQYWDGEKKCINKRPVNDADRQQIMRVVKKYTAKFKGEQKQFQPLASSFLHQRYWESELEGLSKQDDKSSLLAGLVEKFKIKN